MKRRDNGPGVPQEIRDRIWDPFFATKEVDKGVGLGLSITLSIVEKSNGILFLRDDNEGAEFVMSLPAESLTKASFLRNSKVLGSSNEAA